MWVIFIENASKRGCQWRAKWFLSWSKKFSRGLPIIKFVFADMQMIIAIQWSNLEGRTTYQSFFIVANARPRWFFGGDTIFHWISSNLAQDERFRVVDWMRSTHLKKFWDNFMTSNFISQASLGSYLPLKANGTIVRRPNHFLWFQTWALGNFLVSIPKFKWSWGVDFWWTCDFWGFFNFKWA